MVTNCIFKITVHTRLFSTVVFTSEVNHKLEINLSLFCREEKTAMVVYRSLLCAKELRKQTDSATEEIFASDNNWKIGSDFEETVCIFF